MDAILFKGDCLVRAGDLDEAFKTYDLVGTDWEAGSAQEAFYNLGEIKFYQADFEEAVSYYNVTLRQYPDEPRANDAIERLMLVKAVKGDLGTAWLNELLARGSARAAGQGRRGGRHLLETGGRPGPGDDQDREPAAGLPRSTAGAATTIARSGCTPRWGTRWSPPLPRRARGRRGHLRAGSAGAARRSRPTST